MMFSSSDKLALVCMSFYEKYLVFSYYFKVCMITTQYCVTLNNIAQNKTACLIVFS
jgi:hypothetical protein